MKRVLLCGALVWAAPLLAAELSMDAAKVEYGAVQQKVVAPADMDDNLLVSFKVVAKNPTGQDRPVEFWVNGIDVDGFEVKDARFSGTIKARSAQTFTDTFHINQESYQSIVKWLVEPVESE